MRPPRRTAARAAAIVLAVASSAFAQSPPAPAPAREREPGGAVARARAIIEVGMLQSLAPGAQIAVSRAGRTVWSESFGCADVELDVPVARDTRLRIGSVSKPLTAAALGLLVEEGRLDLDLPVQAYVPDFPKKAWPITTRQLAGHLAGIRHYEGDEFQIRDHYPTVRAGLAIFENDALLFEPGTRFSYSSYGWNLLSAVVEGASGEPFLAFMEKRVFMPAGMTHTSADDPAPIVPGRGRFYTRDLDTGAVDNALYVDNSYKWAGGGFLSTAEDLVAFANALLEGRLVRPETLRLLWTSQQTSDGKDTDYGIGWSVDRDSKGRRRVRHSGGAQGGTANLVIYPEERLVVALLVNSDESFTGRAPAIAEVFLDEQ
jgi:CubicO group peptidase (beta-lactamase class C family)